MNVQGRFATLISTMSTGAEDIFTKTRQRVSQRTVPCPVGMDQNMDMVSCFSLHATSCDSVFNLLLSSTIEKSVFQKLRKWRRVKNQAKNYLLDSLKK